MDNFNLNEEKNDLLGELDLLNCFIGFAKSFAKGRKIQKLLTGIQNDIFVIQANVADPENAPCLPENISQDRVIELQEETCLIERGLKEIKHFILPEGDTGACAAHCARAIARQVERKLPGYLNEPTNTANYLDRVACLMFALARKINRRSGREERQPEYVHQKQPNNSRLKRRQKWAKS